MIKIVLTGAESSGKTTLANALVQQYDTALVTEYARIFLEKKDPPQYNITDLCKMAEGQILMEQNIEQNAAKYPLAIYDTDLLTYKIWANEVFDFCPEIITHLIIKQISEPRFYLLCSPEGVVWEADPLRENPHDRLRLHNIYVQELDFYQKKYTILRGWQNERLEAAIKAIEKWQKSIET